MDHVAYRWDRVEGAMRPLPGYVDDVEATYADGEVVVLAETDQRSQRTHSHFFACLATAWSNLPESVAWRFPTAESLRKHALIKSGFCETREYVAATEDEARRFAAHAGRGTGEDYVLVARTGVVVTEFRAMTQRKRAMGAKVFQASKDAVLEVVAGMAQVDPDELRREAGMAA